MTHTIQDIRLDFVRISPKTIWAFLRVTDREGRVGTGEATLAGREKLLAEAARSCLPAWKAGELPKGPLDLMPLPVAALWSACALAFDDLKAQGAGKPLMELYGGNASATIPLYANINRRTVDRSPAGFAASARHALDRGFWALKIAPFDDVTPMGCQDGTAEAAIALGLDRIEAVRSTIGPHAQLMVDCHWRFTPEAARRLIDALRLFGLYWLECPIAETEATIPELVDLRRRCHDVGMKLAGLEEFVGAANFEVFARKGAYDVMMPDIKYVGGPDEMMRAAEMLGRYGVLLSPHNPTGPICHAASLHLCAAMPGSLLELQLDESPLFDKLVKPAPPDVSGGMSQLPLGSGLGLALEERVLSSFLCG